MEIFNKFINFDIGEKIVKWVTKNVQCVIHENIDDKATESGSLKINDLENIFEKHSKKMIKFTGKRNTHVSKVLSFFRK